MWWGLVEDIVILKSLRVVMVQRPFHVESSDLRLVAASTLLPEKRRAYEGENSLATCRNDDRSWRALGEHPSHARVVILWYTGDKRC